MAAAGDDDDVAATLPERLTGVALRLAVGVDERLVVVVAIPKRAMAAAVESAAAEEALTVLLADAEGLGAGGRVVAIVLLPVAIMPLMLVLTILGGPIAADADAPPPPEKLFERPTFDDMKLPPVALEPKLATECDDVVGTDALRPAKGSSGS